MNSDRYFALMANWMRAIIMLFLGGMILITIINLSTGTDLPPWPFYPFALFLCYVLWKITSFFAKPGR